MLKKKHQYKPKQTSMPLGFFFNKNTNLYFIYTSKLTKWYFHYFIFIKNIIKKITKNKYKKYLGFYTWLYLPLQHKEIVKSNKTRMGSGTGYILQVFLLLTINKIVFICGGLSLMFLKRFFRFFKKQTNLLFYF